MSHTKTAQREEPCRGVYDSRTCGILTTRIAIASDDHVAAFCKRHGGLHQPLKAVERVAAERRARWLAEDAGWDGDNENEYATGG